MKYLTRLRKRLKMNPSETSVVVLSDSDNESDTKTVTIDESVDSEIEVITLDDSNVNNISNVTFKVDVTPDFIPINMNVLYNKPKRLKKRRLESSPEVTIVKMRKCLTEDMISFAKKNIKSCPRARNQKRQKQRVLCKSKVTGIKVAESHLKSGDKSENDLKKPKIPQIHLSHTNIHNTVDTPRLAEGLRPIIIDGCNVAFGFGNGEFQVDGIIHVVQYFQKRGHEEIVSFLPQYYRKKFRPLAICEQIKEYEKENIIVYTPSRFLEGKLIKPYDDRFIVQYASERGGVIISNDGYLDLINEEPSWRTTIEQRIVNFTFARGLLMLPKDPLGPSGPTLDEMLKFS